MKDCDMSGLWQVIEEAAGELPSLRPITIDTVLRRSVKQTKASSFGGERIRQKPEIPVDSFLDSVEIVLETDEGELRECQVISTFQIREHRYMVLYPMEDNEEQCIAILRYRLDGNEIVIEEIDSDEEYDEAEDYFLMLMEED